ncbi:hypothetical protein SAMD00019534_064590, partial [Acytostelium subglobosum LB1]|uniref:hypothetical protein n=1 Tax=Acytostelium subglobosum LB1 TaxID=1410327 RepID=UPI00064506AE
MFRYKILWNNNLLILIIIITTLCLVDRSKSDTDFYKYGGDRNAHETSYNETLSYKLNPYLPPPEPQNIDICEALVEDQCLLNEGCALFQMASCCNGPKLVCVNYSDYYFEVAPGSCLLNKQTNEVFNLFFNYIPPLSDDYYELFIPSNASCKELDCFSQGMICALVHGTCKIEDWSCCAPTYQCINRTIPQNITLAPNYHEYEQPLAGSKCELPCGLGFVCKVDEGKSRCMPKNCTFLVCDEYSTCANLPDIGISTCFLKKNVQGVLESCLKETCPPGFICMRGEFTDYDCVPSQEGSFDQNLYNCDQCPPNFDCNKFEWGIVCSESVSVESIVPCYRSQCTYTQFCNHTSRRCEFEACEQQITCGPNMTCLQVDVILPRICVTSESIVQQDFWQQDILNGIYNTASYSLPELTIVQTTDPGPHHYASSNQVDDSGGHHGAGQGNTVGVVGTPS